MIAAVIEIGPELRTVALGIVALGGSYLGSRRASKELRPNHGSSARDVLDRLEASTTEILARLDEHGARLTALEGTPE